MNQYPGDNSVIVMDNARIHHDKELVTLLEGLGCRVVFLPLIHLISIQLKQHSRLLNHGLGAIVILWKLVMIPYTHYWLHAAK